MRALSLDIGGGEGGEQNGKKMDGMCIRVGGRVYGVHATNDVMYVCTYVHAWVVDALHECTTSVPCSRATRTQTVLPFTMAETFYW